MIDTITKETSLASAVSDERAKPVSQYGSGQYQFAGGENALLAGRLVFDDVIDPTRLRQQLPILDVARFRKFSSDHKIAEYTAGIWTMKPSPALY